MIVSAHRIFVSHSHLDNDFGTKLTQDLRRVLEDESAVFYDVLGGLHGGEQWWEKIVEELTARDVFIIVLSPDAMNSIWVRREIDVALNENKYILPLFYRTCTIRADLKILQIISFMAPKPYETAFQEILRALSLPTEAPVTPKEEMDHPSDPATTLRRYIEVAFAEQDWPDVIRKADYLIKYMPAAASSPVYRWRGLALLEEGEVQQAQEALENALALVTNRELRLTLLSDYTALLARQDQWAKVLQRAREALRLVHNDPGWLATQQQAQSQLSNQPTIPSPSKEQVSPKEQQPALPVQKTKEQWLEEGNTLNNLKRYDEALSAFDQAIRLDHNYAPFYTNKGNILRILNRNEEALAAYEQAIRLNPNNADNYMGSGLALSDLKRYHEALVDYEQTIQLNPQYALAYHEKGKALSFLNRYEEALVAFEQAMKLDPSYTGSYTEVLELLRKSIVTPPSPKSASAGISDRDRFDKFTERARKVLSLAQEEAQRFQHDYIGTEHLLLGLVREGEGVAAKVLSNLGVELNKVRSAVEFVIDRGDRIVLGEIGLTPRAKKVIELAIDESHRLNHRYIGTEHLLIGLVREGEGIAAGVLESLGVTLEKVRTQTIQVLSQTSTPQKTQEQLLIDALESIVHEKELAIQKQNFELAVELRDREVKLRDRMAKLKRN